MIKYIKYIIVTIFTVILFSGCGAESELEDMGISYTEDDYFKYGVYKENLNVLELFYEAGMDVNTKNNNNMSALYYAVSKRNLPLIKFLVDDHDAKVDNEASINVLANTYRSYYDELDEILEYLLDNGAKVSDYAAKTFIEKNARKKIQPLGAYIIFAKNGLNKESSTLILENIYGRFYSHFGYKLDDNYKKRNTDELQKDIDKAVELIKILVDNGADIQKGYENLDFGKGIWVGRWVIDFAKIALDNGVDINTPLDKDYKGTLLAQILYDFKEFEVTKPIAKFLIEHGADPLIKDKKGFRNYYPNAINRFCEYRGNGLTLKNRPTDFYPEVCLSKKYEVELFKLIFTNPEKYEQEKSKLSNLIKARNLHKQKKYDEAFKLFLPYAEDNNYEAQEHIADYYNVGRGIEKDLVKSTQWYQKATQHQEANYWVYRQLALAYTDKNHGVIKNLNKAEDLMTKANTLAKVWSKKAEQDTLKLLNLIKKINQ